MTSCSLRVNDPRMKEGYHPTFWEQVRLFVLGIWNPRKLKGIIRGMRYVSREAKKGPKVGSPFLDGPVYTLEGTKTYLSFFLKGRPLVLNFGSYT